jgi:predicted dehydrogenase
VGLRIAVVGAGGFARDFLPLFAAHPGVEEVSLAELLPDRRAEVAAEFGIRRTFASHEDACAAADVDAVAIMTQRHLHGPQAITALEAGKHVWSAVPIGTDAAEIGRILALAAARRLVSMSAETSWYYPDVVFARQRHAEGAFGEIVYAEGSYLHDMSHGFYEAFQRSGGTDWRRVAGVPPMYYATHSLSSVLSVTGARPVSVSCLGWADRTDDLVFGPGRNLWDNPFSNQTALFRTSDGGSVRINEFRRVGWSGRISELPMAIYGTRAVFAEHATGQAWTDLDGNVEDLTERLAFPMDVGYVPSAVPVDETDAHRRYAPVQRWQRLPRAFWSQRNMHLGSHQFLVDDFVRAVSSGRLPPVSAWEAARVALAGITAHESALRDGERLPVPDPGDPPADWQRLDPDDVVS